MRVPITLEIISTVTNLQTSTLKNHKKNQFFLIVRRPVDLCLNLYHHRVRKFNQTLII